MVTNRNSIPELEAAKQEAASQPPRPGHPATLQDIEGMADAFRISMESTGDNLRLVGTMPELGGPAGVYKDSLMSNLASAFALSRALHQDMMAHAEGMKEDGK